MVRLSAERLPAFLGIKVSGKHADLLCWSCLLSERGNGSTGGETSPRRQAASGAPPHPALLARPPSHRAPTSWLWYGPEPKWETRGAVGAAERALTALRPVEEEDGQRISCSALGLCCPLSSERRGGPGISAGPLRQRSQRGQSSPGGAVWGTQERLGAGVKWEESGGRRKAQRSCSLVAGAAGEGTLPGASGAERHGSPGACGSRGSKGNL